MPSPSRVLSTSLAIVLLALPAAAQQRPADGLTDEQRKNMALTLQHIDTTVRDRFLAMRPIDLVPDGYELFAKRNFIFNTGRASQTFMTEDGKEKYTISLELEKEDSKELKAADRYAKWFRPEANNIEEFYQESFGAGDASVSLEQRLPPYTRMVAIYQGRWTLTVSQQAMVGDAVAGYLGNSVETRYEKIEDAVGEMEDLARALWGAFGGDIAQRNDDAGEADEAPSDTIDERAERLLALIEEMNAVLRGVEQPLQELITKIGLLTQSQQQRRREMRELSKLSASLMDPALKKKIQERISRNTDLLRETATEIREASAEARRLAGEARDKVHALYASDDFGELELPALTRKELIDARVQLLDAQIALGTSDYEAAQRAADAMRGNFRLRGHAYYIDGMALLRQGKSLDALAAFRNARESGVRAPGRAFEALERRTEIHILRQLQSLSAETARAFDADYTKWIAGKAELNTPADQTSFEWMVARFLKKPWYDTVGGVTGIGTAEARARGDEAGIVADDMAVNQVGINFIVGLRENLSLDEIRSLSTQGLRNAAAARWGRELPEDQIVRMREAIRHAFEMPEMRALADGEAHLDRTAFSGRLDAKIGQADRWETAAEVAAMGASMVDGWTVLTSLAPSAKLSVVGSGRAMGAADAADRFKNSVTLGEWFAASRPVEGALNALNETRAGRAAIETAARVHEFSLEGPLESVTVMGANMVVDSGAAYAAKEYLGQPAEMLVDALTTLGVTQPQLYHDALQKMTRQRVLDFAETMGRRAAAQRSNLSRLDELLESMPEPGADASSLSGFRERLDAAGIGPDLSDRVEGLAGAIESGNPAMVEQARRDLNRLKDRTVSLAEQAEQASANFRQAAPTLSNPPPALSQRADDPATAPASTVNADLAATLPEPNRTRPGLDGAPTVRADAPGTMPTGDAPSSSAAGEGTARAPGADTPQTGAGTRRAANADDPIVTMDPNDPRATGSGAPRALESEADRLLSAQRFEDAIGAYQAELSGLPDGHPRRGVLEGKIQTARDASDARALIESAGGSGGVVEAPPLSLDAPGAQDAVHEVISGADAPSRWVAVGAEIESAAGTASAPRFVKGPDGKRIAVTKSASGMAGHPEGRAEVLASLLSEKLGRATPKTRLSEFTVDVDGSPERLLLTEMMPDGAELKDLNPTAAQLLARKEGITEDYVFSMLIGDGDRHFGNLRVTPDEKLIGFDYGLADILPNHPYRQDAMLEAVQPLYDDAKRKLDALLDTPGSSQAEIDGLRKELSELQYRTLYYNLEAGGAIPRPGDPGFADFVESSMHMHMTWGSRAWTTRAAFMDSMAFEDFLPHIERLERALSTPGTLDDIVDQAMGGHPDIEYTRGLLKERLRTMKKVFRDRFPSRVGLGTSSAVPFPVMPTRFDPAWRALPARSGADLSPAMQAA